MLLNAEDIHFKYPGDIEVLKGSSFSVDRGEVVAIIGQNGSGKTTLLLIVAGLLEPKKGKILFEDKPLREQLPQARKRIGLVFQDPNDQIFNPTVYDEIAFAPRQIFPFESEVESKVRQIAERLNLSGILNRPPYKLSMGEKRRVTLASVLIYDPPLLLLDEPTANLSYGSVEEIEEIISQAKRDQKGILVASHDVEFVAQVSDRVYILNDGKMLGGLSSKSILSDESFLQLADMKPPLTLQTLKVLGFELKDNPLTIKELPKFTSHQHYC